MTKRKNAKRLLALGVMAAAMSAMTMTCFAATGDVSSAVTSTWTTARQQIVSVVDNVVFPCIDVILAVLLFAKAGLAYMDYRKHGQLEWTPIAIIFGCLIFTLTAPLYIWSVVCQGEGKTSCTAQQKQVAFKTACFLSNYKQCS